MKIRITSKADIKRNTGRLSLLATVWICCASTFANANGGILPPNYPNADLINKGRKIFFNETFDGNGRTCGTCHLEDNNFTIDPRSIAKARADDPLFLAERQGNNPLAKNFEKPELMHKVGLILENTNGFDDLQHNFTMRSVSHLLAMRNSITAPSDAANDGTALPPDQRTGWGGDGSPTDLSASPQLLGTLRDFTVGAIKQHLPKTLHRVAGEDFRLPTAFELDALEAFMLSLGRQEEADFTLITAKDERAEMGRRNYLGEDVAGILNCNACHFNGGANSDPDFDFPAAATPPAFEATNRSFRPRIEEFINQPGDVVFGRDMPFDDGFGTGTNLFNAPTTIEAADTGPFFHSNQIDTVEGLVAFYAAQRVLRNGDILPPIMTLNGSQIVNIAAFLRVINADENVRSALDLIIRAKKLTPHRERRVNLHIAKTEIIDAIEVLDRGNLHFTDAVPLFKQAKRQLRRRKLDNAINTLRKARRVMIDRSAS